MFFNFVLLTFWADNSLSPGHLQCTVGHLIAFLASAHQIPVPPRCVNQNMSRHCQKSCRKTSGLDQDGGPAHVTCSPRSPRASWVLSHPILTTTSNRTVLSSFSHEQPRLRLSNGHSVTLCLVELYTQVAWLWSQIPISPPASCMNVGKSGDLTFLCLNFL